jgi:Transcriptional regulator
MVVNSEDKIINAAIEVFAKRGFDIATTDEIAKRSGISKGTVFLHFKKKDDLIQNVAILSVPYDLIVSTISGNYKSAEDLLTEFGLSFLKKYSNENMRALLIMTMAYKDRYKKIKAKLKAACFDKMDQLFKKVEEMAGFAIPQPMRRAFFGSLLCYIIWWDDNKIEPEEYVRALVKGILNSASSSASH